MLLWISFTLLAALVAALLMRTGGGVDGAAGHDPGLDIAFDVIIKSRPAIFSDDFGIGIRFFDHDHMQIGQQARKVQIK